MRREPLSDLKAKKSSINVETSETLIGDSEAFSIGRSNFGQESLGRDGVDRWIGFDATGN